MSDSRQSHAVPEFKDYFVENKESFAFFVGLIGAVKLFDSAPASPFSYIFGFFMLSAATWTGWQLFRNCPKFEGLGPQLWMYKYCLGAGVLTLGSYVAWFYRSLTRDVVLPLVMLLIFNLYDKLDHKFAINVRLKRQGNLRWLIVLAISMWVLVIGLYLSDWFNSLFDSFPRPK